MTDTKRCTNCGLVKSLESFYRYHRNKDGRVSRCKRCFLLAKKYNTGARRAVARWLWMTGAARKIR